MHAIGRIPRLVTCLVVSLVAVLALAAAAFAKPAVTDARLEFNHPFRAAACDKRRRRLARGGVSIRWPRSC
jgi:hypothetical protein